MALEKASTVENAAQNFRATEIYPFNRNIFADVDFSPAEVTDPQMKTTVMINRLLHVRLTLQ